MRAVFGQDDSIPFDCLVDPACILEFFGCVQHIVARPWLQIASLTGSDEECIILNCLVDMKLPDVRVVARCVLLGFRCIEVEIEMELPVGAEQLAVIP